MTKNKNGVLQGADRPVSFYGQEALANMAKEEKAMSFEETMTAYKDMTNDRLMLLEQKFEALCQHLQVNVYKPFGFTVQSYGGGLQSKGQVNGLDPQKEY